MFSRSTWIFALGVSLLAAPIAAASNWQPDGTPVCMRERAQLAVATLADGNGGAFVVWQDNRATVDFQVYVQRIDAGGHEQWAADGIRLSSEQGSASNAQVVTDGSGGIIVIWAETRTDNDDIYAQRVSPDGTPLWDSGGVLVCGHSAGQASIRICSDGFGGAMVTWHDFRSGHGDVFAQRIDGSGAVLWDANGVDVCVRENTQWNADIAPDGTGGAYIAWTDARSGTDDDIYLQRLNASGVALWPTNGIGINTGDEDHSDPRVVADEDQGVLIVWREYDDGIRSTYAQRTASDASPVWAPGGIVISSSGNWVPFGQVQDGHGGMLVLLGNLDDISLQIMRINPAGLTLWDSNLGTSAVSFSPLWGFIGDGEGGAFGTWIASDGKLYAQRFGAAGNVMWGPSGRVVSGVFGYREYPLVVSDEYHETIIVWTENRDLGTSADVYAQHFNAEGHWGQPYPWIHSVLDVPGDEGGVVNLAWNSSGHDPSGGITEYTIWRALETARHPETGRLRAEAAALDPYYWEFVQTHGAYQLPMYAATVPTLFDSTAVCDDLHYFQVIAHTADPGVYFESGPASGYSVDNLAPGAPARLAGEVLAEVAGLRLTWDPNPEPDLAGYRVYRGDHEDFVPGPENLLAESVEIEFVDPDWIDGYWYKVTAVDIHGNESPVAVLGPDGVVDTPSPGAAPLTGLSPISPNPFNPVTRIHFTLAEAGAARLGVYDVAGRLVRLLVDGPRGAGAHDVKFDGRDDRGLELASGRLYVRLRVGAHEETRTMTLLR